MKIILLENIKGLGQIGDIKNVSDGYARNFLFPKKIAKLATDAALKEVDSLKKKLETAQRIERESAIKLTEQLKNVFLEFTRKATKTGKLFSSVTKEDVAETLTKRSGFRVEPNSVNFEEHRSHIKQLGEHVVKVKLAPNVVGEVKIKVSQPEK